MIKTININNINKIKMKNFNKIEKINDVNLIEINKLYGTYTICYHNESGVHAYEINDSIKNVNFLKAIFANTSYNVSEKNCLSYNKFFDKMDDYCLSIRIYNKNLYSNTHFVEMSFEIEDKLSPKIYVDEDSIDKSCSNDNYEYDTIKIGFVENYDNDPSKTIQKGLDKTYTQMIKMLKKQVQTAKNQLSKEEKKLEEAELTL